MSSPSFSSLLELPILPLLCSQKHLKNPIYVENSGSKYALKQSFSFYLKLANIFQVMLGSGNPEDEEWMRATESTYKEKFRGWVGFNVPISHRITAR